MKPIGEWFSRQKEAEASNVAAPMSSYEFRSGRYTVVIYDDDYRPMKTFHGCVGLTEEHFNLKFHDETGLRRHFVGMAYSTEEEI